MSKFLTIFLLGLTIIFSLTTAPYAAALENPAVIIYHEGTAQFEIISPKGVRVLTDVYNGELITAPVTINDILLTTHTHPDHIDELFYPKFTGKQLFAVIGGITRDDVKISSIAASHNLVADPIDPQNATNFIFLIEIGDLRIAHFGDIGQAELLPDQLAALGKIDVAIMQFNNSYSSMNLTNKKGFNLMQQVKPRLIIPTHIDLETARYAVTVWKSYYAEKGLKVSRAVLTDATILVFAGENDRGYSKALNLPNAPF
jgi:hypothetical protein